MDDVIDIRGLHKSFGSTQALDGLDLSVATGEVHGFLGPNGAGKSTTIRLLVEETSSRHRTSVRLRLDSRHDRVLPGLAARR